jgi:hypothetical protein
MFQPFQHKLAIALVAASTTWGCARYGEGTSAGTTIDPAEAAQTAVLNVKNENGRAMELRSILNGQSTFIGSIGPSDNTSILLDANLLPTSGLYIVAIPDDGRGRALVGPLTATKGDKINFTIRPTLSMSNATVRR